MKHIHHKAALHARQLKEVLMLEEREEDAEAVVRKIFLMPVVAARKGSRST